MSAHAMERQKTYLNWSSGKDSALALYYLLQDEQVHVARLLTSVNGHHQRVSMHGVRVELLQQQMAATGISGDMIVLPEQPTNAVYENLMEEKVRALKEQGFQSAAFGDIYLEDLKRYREQQLKKLDMNAVFPLWGRDTKALLREWIGLGFKAIVVCVNAAMLDRSFAGRLVDEDFLRDLPAGVDPCGEEGSFHTFCFDGPVFRYPVRYSIGETVRKEYRYGNECSAFWFCDLLPEGDDE